MGCPGSGNVRADASPRANLNATHREVLGKVTCKQLEGVCGG